MVNKWLIIILFEVSFIKKKEKCFFCFIKYEDIISDFNLWYFVFFCDVLSFLVVVYILYIVFEVDFGL